MMLSEYFCDFHIHVGKSKGKPVKMAAAPSLTLDNLVTHAKKEKGLDVITVIDGVCTHVLEEIEERVADGRWRPLTGGGYEDENGLVILLGAEVEVGGPSGGAAHFGCWFDSIQAARDFNHWLATVQKNVSLSSQRARTDAFTLQSEVKERDGLFIIHHAFTPHKGMYGNCVKSMREMVDPSYVDAVELGLSADTDMADCLNELEGFTFLTNSDAHSLPKIAREYNRLRMGPPNFQEVRRAFHRMQGRCVDMNFGLQPKLGKYHRTSCLDCGKMWTVKPEVCDCGSRRLVYGVFDRLCDIRDVEVPVHPDHRPPYVHQVPLEFVPGLGPKSLKKLLDAFENEMTVLHRASVSDIAEVVGRACAERIDLARTGQVNIQSGGAGVYGKLQFEP